MAVIPRTAVSEAKLKLAVKRAEQALQPDVLRIRYNVGQDWSGEEALFFRVLLTDRASAPAKLGKLARLVRAKIDQEVNPERYGLFPYVSFRSKSEQDELKDPSWE